MKTIKVTKEVHKKLMPLTTKNGDRKTISEVIDEKISDLPFASENYIRFDQTIRGQILLADFYLSDVDPNVNNICAELCIYFKVPSKEYRKGILHSNLVIINDLYVGGEHYFLKCDNPEDFVAEPHLVTENNDVYVVSLFIDNYMKYCRKKESNKNQE